MRIPTHLRQSRHGIFFFRIVVPKALRPVFYGRSEIKRSLHTRNVRIALVQARQMSLAAYQLFDLVKSSMTGKIDINDPSTLTSENVVGRFEYTVEEDLNTGKRITRIKTDPSNPDSIAAGRAVAMAIETKKQLLMGKVETNNPEALAADEQLRRELAEIVGAEQPNVAIVSATLPVASPNGEEYTPAVPRQKVLDTTKLTPKDRGCMLSNLWAAYAKQETKSNWTKGPTPQEYSQKFGIFLDWIGDRPIHWVTKQDYSAFKNWMLTDYRTSTWKPGQATGIAARSLDKYK